MMCPNPPRRRLLAATVVAASTLGAALILIQQPGRGGRPGPAEPPWALPSLAALAARDGSGGGAASAAPAALVYVDRACPHCDAELARWDSLLVGASPGLGGDVRARVLVIASPASPMDDLRWVPSSLRARTVHDADGEIARELGVRAVPTTFWVDAADTVRAVRTGQTGASTLITLVNSHLRQPP